MSLIRFLSPDFKFENENGLLLQLVHGGWKQVNVIFSKKNGIRGGHFHKFNREAFYVISGAFNLRISKDNIDEKYEIKAGDFFLICENVIHTFEYTEDTWLVSMYSKGVEIDEHTKDIWG